MDADPIIATIEQPDSNDQSQTIHQKPKHCQEIWEALESLTSPDLMNRIAGLGRITELKGSCRYPLVIYVLVSRITEPDIELRMAYCEAAWKYFRARLARSQESFRFF